MNNTNRPYQEMSISIRVMVSDVADVERVREVNSECCSEVASSPLRVRVPVAVAVVANFGTHVNPAGFASHGGSDLQTKQS